MLLMRSTQLSLLSSTNPPKAAFLRKHNCRDFFFEHRLSWIVIVFILHELKLDIDLVQIVLPFPRWLLCPVV